MHGDAGHLRQVLMNLVGNAVKFTDQGRVRVDVDVAAGAPEDARTRLRFTVTDTGIGIPASAQQKIFESFTQTDGSITRRYGGTGLGLAISRGLAEAMQGRLDVSSEPGKGSTFTLTLPAAIDKTLAVGQTVSVHAAGSPGMQGHGLTP